MKKILILLLVLPCTMVIAAQQKLRIVDENNRPLRNKNCFLQFSNKTTFSIPFVTDDEGRGTVTPQIRGGANFIVVIQNYGVSDNYFFSPNEEVSVMVKQTPKIESVNHRKVFKFEKTTSKTRGDSKNKTLYPYNPIQGDSIRQLTDDKQRLMGIIDDMEIKLLEKIREITELRSLLDAKDQKIYELEQQKTDLIAALEKKNHQLGIVEKDRDYYQQESQTYLKELEAIEAKHTAEDLVTEKGIWLEGRRYEFDKKGIAQIKEVCSDIKNLKIDLKKNKKTLKRLVKLIDAYNTIVEIKIIVNIRGQEDDSKRSVAQKRGKEVWDYFKFNLKSEQTYEFLSGQESECIKILVKKKGA